MFSMWMDVLHTLMLGGRSPLRGIRPLTSFFGPAGLPVTLVIRWIWWGCRFSPWPLDHAGSCTSYMVPVALGSDQMVSQRDSHIMKSPLVSSEHRNRLNGNCWSTIVNLRSLEEVGVIRVMKGDPGFCADTTWYQGDWGDKSQNRTCPTNLLFVKNIQCVPSGWGLLYLRGSPSVVYAVTLV